MAEISDDPPRNASSNICRDPDDDYLIALTEGLAATFLVSGDADLLDLARPGLDVRSPRDAVDAILYHHPWGRAPVPGEAEVLLGAVQVEGHINVLRTAAVFLEIVDDANAPELLRHIVTPESEQTWRADLAAVRAMARHRGMTTRPSYPSPDVAYVKLPPDPGEVVKATGDVLLEGAVILSMQRRPELPDVLGLGGWRVHGIGDYVRPEEMPPGGARYGGSPQL